MIWKIGAVASVDALTKIIGYLLLPIYLGLMPKEEFGEYGFLVAAVAPFSLIVGLGLYVPFIRSFCSSNDDNQRCELVSTVFNSLLLWLIALDIVTLVLKPWLITSFCEFFGVGSYATEKYHLTLLLINTNVALLYCYSLLMARKHTAEIVAFTLIKFGLTAALSLAVLYFGTATQDSAANRLLGTAAAELTVLAIFVVAKTRQYLKPTIVTSILIDHVRLASPLILSALFGLLNAVIDRKLLEAHHGLGELAGYNLATQALAPIPMLMAAVQLAWAPQLFAITERRMAFSSSLRVMYFSCAAMLGGTLAIYLSLHFALSFGLISAEYANVPGLALLLSAGVIPGSLMHLCSNLFLQYERPAAQLLFSLVSLALCWISCIALIPQFAAYGAALASIIANLVSLAGALFLLNRMAGETSPVARVA